MPDAVIDPSDTPKQDAGVEDAVTDVLLNCASVEVINATPLLAIVVVLAPLGQIPEQRGAVGILARDVLLLQRIGGLESRALEAGTLEGDFAARGGAFCFEGQRVLLKVRGSCLRHRPGPSLSSSPTSKAVRNAGSVSPMRWRSHSRGTTRFCVRHSSRAAG